MSDDLSAIEATEISEAFIKGMKDRMIMSYYKYGPVAEGVVKIQAIANVTARIREYAKTGNTEWLIDAANFCMMEFMYPMHPKAHFRGTDSEESPGRISAKTGRPDRSNNQSMDE